MNPVNSEYANNNERFCLDAMLKRDGSEYYFEWLDEARTTGVTGDVVPLVNDLPWYTSGDSDEDGRHLCLERHSGQSKN